MHDVLLLGNNLAMLVAALELAAKGRKVGLLLDGGTAGGHFAGARLEGNDFDVGMVLFERGASVTQSRDPGDYQPRRRNDSARFTSLTAEYLDRYISTVRAPCPQVFADGRRHADFVVANRLDYFSALANAGALRDELAGRSAANELHASRKLASTEYDFASYAQASLFNHGATLHGACFEPLCEKILGVPSSTILARYHRLGWLPLYYPETLAKAVAGEQAGLVEYPFWSAAGGFSGELVSSLRRALGDSTVELVDGAVAKLMQEEGGYRISVQDVEYRSRHLALGLSPERASQLLQLPAAQAPRGVSVGVLLGLVHRDHLSDVAGCMFVQDPAYAIYRVTDQDACAGLDADWHRISVESNPGYVSRLYPKVNAERQQDCLLGELVHLGVIAQAGAFRPLRHIRVANALPLPTASAVCDVARFVTALADRPGLELTGGLLGMGVSSINDQIVQGLRLAGQWG